MKKLIALAVLLLVVLLVGGCTDVSVRKTRSLGVDTVTVEGRNGYCCTDYETTQGDNSYTVTLTFKKEVSQ